MTIESVDMSGFNAGLRGLSRLGIPMSDVVRKETGELIKTLVRNSPAADAKKIKGDIRRKFAIQSIAPKVELQGQRTKSGLNLISVNEHYLTGVSPQLDKRDAGTHELKQLLYSFTKGGKIRKSFRPPRKVQKFLLITKLLAKKKTVNALADAKAKNSGRLKASWLSAVYRGAIRLAGASKPPALVLRHMNSRLRGYHISELNNKTFPAFTIASNAKGINSRSQKNAIAFAMAIRAKAMAANAALYFRGKKNIADYASV